MVTPWTSWCAVISFRAAGEPFSDPSTDDPLFCCELSIAISWDKGLLLLAAMAGALEKMPAADNTSEATATNRTNGSRIKYFFQRCPGDGPWASTTEWQGGLVE